MTEPTTFLCERYYESAFAAQNALKKELMQALGGKA
jgi:hypothetical protein